MLAELVDQELVGPARDDDAHVVTGFEQVLDHDATSRCVTHAFTDDTVEDAHDGPFAAEPRTVRAGEPSLWGTGPAVRPAAAVDRGPRVTVPSHAEHPS